MENLVVFVFDTIDLEWYFHGYYSVMEEAENNRKSLLLEVDTSENYIIDECVVIEKCPPFMDLNDFITQWMEYKNSKKEFPPKKLVDFKTSSFVEKEKYCFIFGKGPFSDQSFVAVKNGNEVSLKLEKWEVLDFYKYLEEYIKQRWGENA